MARKVDVTQIRDELIQAFKEGDEARARAHVFQLGGEPRQVRAALEAMLEAQEGLVRQAAAFGLGELGGAASIKRLERQLTIEEARGDHDGHAVAGDITRALGRIEGGRARASLVRRLERLAAGKPERSDVNELARALWRKRHPELISPVRKSLEKISLPAPHGLHGLLVLLEKSPEELLAWASDSSVPVGDKARVLAVLEEDVPGALLPVLPAFIATAHTLVEMAMPQARRRETENYCERLFSLLLLDKDRFLPALQQQARAMLRSVARNLIAATFPLSSLWAVAMLEAVGLPEDAEFVEAHRPDDPGFAKDFDEVAQALRGLQKN
ncbi:MAG TPA: hypothetical protein VK539_34290 [Myxococcaceae bacterium]|nr:hypothetical protein [Myxococcaceae bacterium]